MCLATYFVICYAELVATHHPSFSWFLMCRCCFVINFNDLSSWSYLLHRYGLIQGDYMFLLNCSSFLWMVVCSLQFTCLLLLLPAAIGVSGWDFHALHEYHHTQQWVGGVVELGMACLVLNVGYPHLSSHVSYTYIANLFWQVVYILFWGVVVMATLFYLYSNSWQFIDTPKLVQTDDKKTQWLHHHNAHALGLVSLAPRKSVCTFTLGLVYITNILPN